MKRRTCMLIIVVLTLLPLAALAGQTDSPGDPTTTAGHMPTLEELYQYLTSGATPGTAEPFQEPSASPGATMKTLQELYEDFKALIELCTVAPEHVLQGQTFFQTIGTWGPAAGMMPDHGAVTITPGTDDQSIAQGYHNGSGVVTGDSELTPTNIVAGATIFGVTGTAPTLDPDPDLTPENIACGVTIYGVIGTHGIRFRDNGDGTVTDNHTGLVWLKDADCLGTRNWEDAQRYIAGLNAGLDFACDGYNPRSYDDWHLPTLEEMHTLIDDRFTRPALSNTCGTGQWTSGDAFTGVQAFLYWSSTEEWTGWGWTQAWYVSLYNGNVSTLNKKEHTCYVWPVRGGLENPCFCSF